jgi:hypothetical protein
VLRCCRVVPGRRGTVPALWVISVPGVALVSGEEKQRPPASLLQSPISRPLSLRPQNNPLTITRKHRSLRSRPSSRSNSSLGRYWHLRLLSPAPLSLALSPTRGVHAHDTTTTTWDQHSLETSMCVALRCRSYGSRPWESNWGEPPLHDLHTDYLCRTFAAIRPCPSATYVSPRPN